MFHSSQTAPALRASAITVLCSALLATGAMAADATLQTIDVTPAAKTISVGQHQSFAATGTFSNGSRQVLGPAISNIAPGSTATCAVLTSGGVECWGINHYGQLGNGTTVTSLIPRPVKGITTATAVALGNAHGCALLASGAVKCWGYNGSGELGNGTFANSSTPVAVHGISNATAVAVGDEFSCALLASGAVQCWGHNGYSQLGTGSNAESNIPVTVIGITTASAISLGMRHGCALLVSGAVQCWGYNLYGQLGDGSNSYSSNIPVAVNGTSTAIALSVGWFHSCALLAGGAVQCWGDNRYGQLGNGSDARSFTTPVFATGISSAIAVTAGGEHSCAMLRNGFVRCWGSNVAGQLGNVVPGDGSTTSVRARGIRAPVRLAAGEAHNCALLADGAMRCWGWGLDGQLGNQRKIHTNAYPVNVVGTPGVEWTSSDASKATITDRGVATGRAVGNTTITATTPGLINDNAVLTMH